jgi:xanthine dehydrogenase large subunit
MRERRYGIGWSFMPAQATVRIYNDDGSVEVNVSGCEIGQGLYTKVAQAVAYKLGIDISLVNVVPTRSDATPVIFYTGGSFGSEMSCGVRWFRECAVEGV